MKTKHALWASLSLVAPLLVGCGAKPPVYPTNVQIPVPDAPSKDQSLEPARESPPESGPPRETPFPKIDHQDLPSGLALDVVQARTLPLVQIRVLVKSGASADGDTTGLANFTAKMLKDGGAGRYASKDLLAKIEALGADLGVEVGPDSTVLSLAIPKARFDEAMDVLGTVTREPRWDEQEFGKLKKRQIQKAADKAKSSGGWSATMLLWRELYRLPTGVHPYASYDARPSELTKITTALCRDFYKKNFTPKNTTILVGGDIDVDAARKAVEKAFGSWKGPEVAAPSFAEATAPERLKIFLADRPKSAQSDVYVGMLGPSRKDDSWTAVKVANQVLGGGVSGRLFLDVREKQSLAYSTRSTVGEVARGPVPLIAYAGTQTAKTGLAVQALLDNLKRISGEAAAEEELNTARRYLADIFAVRMETVGSVTDMVVALRVLGLPDDYYDTYRKEIGAVTGELAQKGIGEHVREGHAVIAVSGDADKIGAVLSHFGEVVVVNPEKEFERVKTIPMNASAPIELERETGQ
ncbi:MAG TPA: pitrilysin family protein [Polyangiaceae bacterium]|jgi:predicted Zn-dependent peptidase|nr:pitrilysin family protein [Polyangiaceae bacterium]